MNNNIFVQNLQCNLMYLTPNTQVLHPTTFIEYNQKKLSLCLKNFEVKNFKTADKNWIQMDITIL